MHVGAAWLPTPHLLGPQRVRSSLKAKVRHHPVLEILEKERPEAVAETANRALNGEPRAASPVRAEATHTHQTTSPGLGLRHPLRWQTGCGAGGKESACQCKRHKSQGLDPWVGKIWRREWQLQCSHLENPMERGAWQLQLQRADSTERTRKHTHTHAHARTHAHTHTHTPLNTKPGGLTWCFSG